MMENLLYANFERKTNKSQLLCEKDIFIMYKIISTSKFKSGNCYKKLDLRYMPDSNSQPVY